MDYFFLGKCNFISWVREIGNMKSLYNFQLKTVADHQLAYKKSIENPTEFWEEIAATFTWKSPWSEVLRI